MKTGMFQFLFREASKKQEILAGGRVVPDPSRCVQCGICNYNCPIDIDVRLHALRGQPVQEKRCLTCGECVLRCPRGVLRFENDPGEQP
jgi:ferredoxin